MPVQFEIHPSIGIARIGTSDEFFIGPGPGVTRPTSYRDASLRLLKQAAQFRVFRCERDEQGRLTAPPTEVTPADAAVTWRVEVANRKATAVRLDQPSNQTTRRNNATGDENTDRPLIIGPVARTVDAASPNAEFDGGAFRGHPVHLGRIAMQADGSVIFTGASGLSGSRTADGGTRGLQHFADNSDWWDDTCEGPVSAQVRLPDGSTHPALAARVIVGPPDYAPDIEAFVTMADVAFQVAVERGFLQAAERPSFSRDILPVLRRAPNYAWVNRRAGQGHGPGANGDFTARFAQLANPSAPTVIRKRIFDRLRRPGSTNVSTSSNMPRLFSEEGYRDNQKKVIALPPAIFHYFEQWVAGEFEGDFGQDPHANEAIVDALDRMALEGCAGGGFFPGIEAPRFMRNPAHWIAPFRLDPAIPPGRVTEGLAVPWQADFSACRWESDANSETDPNGFAWWPSQRPDHVFRSAADVASGTRVQWHRGADSAEELIEHFAQLGIIVRQTAATGDIYVETERVLQEGTALRDTDASIGEAGIGAAGGGASS